MPKVTILMPTFNVASWVEEAISSVLDQTYQNFELLGMDDCSTDNTLEVVQYAKKFGQDTDISITKQLNDADSLVISQVN